MMKQTTSKIVILLLFALFQRSTFQSDLHLHLNDFDVDKFIDELCSPSPSKSSSVTGDAEMAILDGGSEPAAVAASPARTGPSSTSNIFDIICEQETSSQTDSQGSSQPTTTSSLLDMPSMSAITTITAPSLESTQPQPDSFWTEADHRRTVIDGTRIGLSGPPIPAAHIADYCKTNNARVLHLASGELARTYIQIFHYTTGLSKVFIRFGPGEGQLSLLSIEQNAIGSDVITITPITDLSDPRPSSIAFSF